MKDSFLKLTLLGLVLAVIPFVNGYAALQMGEDIYIPILQSGFEFKITGNAIRPSSGNLDYAVLTSPTPIPNWRVKTLKPQYHFGFGVGARYVFSCTGNDLQVNWIHYSRGDSNSVAGSTSEFVGPFLQVNSTANLFNEAKSDIKFQFDVADLTVGQFVNFGPRLQFRFFGGLSVARILQTHTTDYHDRPKTFSVNAENFSKFLGLGPRFGISSSYDLCYGFTLVGQIGGSLFTGTQKSTTEYNSFSPVINQLDLVTNNQEIRSTNTTRVVPGLDAKLGINYSHPFGRKSLFTLEAGYQAAVYFNAVRAFNPNTVIAPLATGPVAVATMGKTESNFAINGPFVAVKIKI